MERRRTLGILTTISSSKFRSRKRDLLGLTSRKLLGKTTKKIALKFRPVPREKLLVFREKFKRQLARQRQQQQLQFGIFSAVVVALVTSLMYWV